MDYEFVLVLIATNYSVCHKTEVELEVVRNSTRCKSYIKRTMLPPPKKYTKLFTVKVKNSSEIQSTTLYKPPNTSPNI